MGRAAAVSDDSYSSGEEDGDAAWRAAISSVSNPAVSSSNRNHTSDSALRTTPSIDDGEDHGYEPQKVKHYQIKAQKLLEGILEKNLEIVQNSADKEDVKIDDGDGLMTNGGGIRLFKHAPPGVIFDHTDELQGPKKRPNLIPGEEIDDKSKKFKRKLESVAVDGADIIAAADNAYKKSLAWLNAKEVKAREAAKEEERRVAELKRIRGERWLPSMAREMQSPKPVIRPS